jgi:Rps23 Pro-64 3,4-dihydroxylase Tpa1-like proline 4-hydroxylase
MINLQKLNLKELKDNFTTSYPFNYLFLDNFLEQKIADRILNDLNTDDYSTWDKRADAGVQVKDRSNWRNDTDVPQSTRNLIQYLNSGDFLRCLSEITGIQGIIPDPYLTGGGFNKINRGGTLAIHADGNWHDLMAVHRRLNLIIYLNKNWLPEWGGNLELWSNKDSRPDKCEKEIEPYFNRLVLFKTDDYSFHGHPKQLNCPENVSRKSLILYYYTSTRPSTEVESLENKHRAIFHQSV